MSCAFCQNAIALRRTFASRPTPASKANERASAPLPGSARRSSGLALLAAAAACCCCCCCCLPLALSPRSLACFCAHASERPGKHALRSFEGQQRQKQDGKAHAFCWPPLTLCPSLCPANSQAHSLADFFFKSNVFGPPARPGSRVMQRARKALGSQPASNFARNSRAKHSQLATCCLAAVER